MTVSILQSSSVTIYSGVSTPTATFPGNCTNGSRIVVRATQENGGGTFAAADPTNGSYGAAHASVGTGGGQVCSAAGFSKANTATTALTITLTLGASSDGALIIDELQGSAGTPTFDAVGSNQALLGTFTHTVTTVGANAAVLSIGCFYPSGAAPDTGFTASFTETGVSLAYHYGEHDDDVGAAGAKALTYGGGGIGTNYFAAVAMSFISTGGGGGTVGNQYPIRFIGGM